MSAFGPIPSALIPKADVVQKARLGLLLLRVVGPLPLKDGASGSGGRGPTSVRGGNRGGARLGGAASSVYGDSTAALGGIEGRWIRLTGMIRTRAAARGAVFGGLAVAVRGSCRPNRGRGTVLSRAAPWPAAKIGIAGASRRGDCHGPRPLARGGARGGCSPTRTLAADLENG